MKPKIVVALDRLLASFVSTAVAEVDGHSQQSYTCHQDRGSPVHEKGRGDSEEPQSAATAGMQQMPRGAIAPRPMSAAPKTA